MKAEQAWKEYLAIELIARFTGNSRGTPIAKKGFADGYLEGISDYKAALRKELTKELSVVIGNDSDFDYGQEKAFQKALDVLDTVEPIKEYSSTSTNQSSILKVSNEMFRGSIDLSDFELSVLKKTFKKLIKYTSNLAGRK